MPDHAVPWPDPQRHAAFLNWLAPLLQRHALVPESLRPASADASFRRYLRLDSADGSSRIIMDAPPPQEDVRPFLQVAALIEAAGLHAPRVLEADPNAGFLLLQDLGSRLYLDALREASPQEADRLMRGVIDALVQWQQRVDATTLPPYDEALLQRELALFPEWCVAREFGVAWNDAQRNGWQQVCRLLVDSALAQPQVAVHRDWMPRNLMIAEPGPGILDFQDAVRGPISYDLASLLRDAFWSWDEERELDWAVRYWEKARAAGLLPPGGDSGSDSGSALGDDFGSFWRALEWMGLQRHLKVLGIFCRLKHRDAKPKYAEDLPRFFGYAIGVARRYRELAPLLPLLEPLAGTTSVIAYSLR